METNEEIKEETIANNDGWTKQEGVGMWLPEKENDELIGKVEDILEGTYGNQYLIRKQGTDETIKTPSHKVLQGRMTKVQKGDTIKIIYRGEEAPSVKGQNPTKIYEVFVKE